MPVSGLLAAALKAPTPVPTLKPAAPVLDFDPRVFPCLTLTDKDVNENIEIAVLADGIPLEQMHLYGLHQSIGPKAPAETKQSFVPSSQPRRAPDAAVVSGRGVLAQNVSPQARYPQLKLSGGVAWAPCRPTTS